MSELVESNGLFYLNAETFNDTSSPIDAVINISDRDDILKFQDKWCCHITRFAVDTQESLYYVKPDDDTWVTLTCIQYTLLPAANQSDSTRHFVDQRTLRMTKGASTLADFLYQLNENVPVIKNLAYRDQTAVVGARAAWKCGVWTVTPSGGFKFKATLVDDAGKVRDLNGHASNVEEYMVNLKMSDKMRSILGFSKAHCRVQGEQSHFRRWKEMLANFMEQLPAYRKNIRNWRWEGDRRHWRLNNWFNEMWYIINNVILKGVPLNRTGHIDATGHTQTRGDFARGANYVTHNVPCFDTNMNI